MDTCCTQALFTRIRALEIIFSLPPETTIDIVRYFGIATAWLEQYFEAPVISAIVHNDEAAPHCHVLLLPLVGGRMIGSDLMGGRAKLQALQVDFHAQVGQRHGLARQEPHKRLSAPIRRQALDSAVGALEANSGLNSDLLRVLVEPHLKNPEPLLLALGLAMPQPKAKGTFAGIMTKPCKPEKPIGFSRSKSIGFEVDAPKKEQTLSCVGFDNPAQPISPVIKRQNDAIQSDHIRQRDADRQAGIDTATGQQPAPAAQPDFIEDRFTRHRDADQPSGCWDESTGDFIKPMVKASCKQAVMASVNTALESIGASGKAPAGAMRC